MEALARVMPRIDPIVPTSVSMFDAAQKRLLQPIGLLVYSFLKGLGLGRGTTQTLSLFL